MVTAGVRRLWVVVMDNEAVVFGFYLPAVLHPLYTSSVLRFLRLTLSLPRPPFLAGPKLNLI